MKMRLDLRDDLVIPAPIQGDLQSIIRLLEDPARTRFLGLEVPTGLLLVGHGEREDFYCQSDREPDQP